MKGQDLQVNGHGFHVKGLGLQVKGHGLHVKGQGRQKTGQDFLMENPRSDVLALQCQKMLAPDRLEVLGFPEVLGWV